MHITVWFGVLLYITVCGLWCCCASLCGLCDVVVHHCVVWGVVVHHCEILSSIEDADIVAVDTELSGE